MQKIKYTNKDIEKLYEPDYFYNHGDNPALKRFMELSIENHGEGRMLDYRTYYVDKAKRFLWARNWEDLLQRDFKAVTFPRAAAVFTLSTMAFCTTLSWAVRLLPVGRRGIKTISQTSFYHNFGPIGVAGVGIMVFTAAYLEYKTAKFTAHKFWRHVVMGDRNWLLEADKEPAYGEYYFTDNPWSADENFPLEARVEMAMKARPTPTFKNHLEGIQ